MENLLGFAGAATGLLILFVLYLGGAALLLKLFGGLLSRRGAEG